MKGTPDEWNFLDPLDINNYIQGNPIDFDMLYNCCTDGKLGVSTADVEGRKLVKVYDSEYDIFNYVLPNGKQGHFILKGLTGSKVAMTIPYDPIKIQYTKASTPNGYIESLTITDVDGTKYKFGKIDAASINAIEGNDEPDIVSNRLGWVPTAWYLTKIISNDAIDEISLFYNTQSMSYYAPTQTATIRDRLRNYDIVMWINQSTDPYILDLKSDLVAWHFDQTDIPNESIHKNNVPVLSSVQFNGGSAYLSYTPNTNILSNIIINRGTVPYKKVQFNYTLPGGGLHFLNNISFYGEDQTTQAEKYDLSYYPGNFYSPAESAVLKDWFGYRVSQVGQGLLLRQTAPIVSIPLNLSFTQNLGFEGINREPHEYSMIEGMLQTITYPTGGQTEFIYETNKYDWKGYYSPGNYYLQDGPGLRIKEVISRPVQGNVVHKRYKYGFFEDGRGYINDYLRPGSASFAELKIMESNTMHFWTMNAETQNWAVDMAGHRTRRYFADPYISFDLSGSNIKYDAVTEYIIETEPSGMEIPKYKTQTRYSWGDDVELTTFNITDRDEQIHYPRKFSNPEYAWQKPVMTGKTFYKYDKGQFAPIRNETYNYSQWQREEAWDLPTYLHTNANFAITGTGFSGYSGGKDKYLTSKDYHQVHCSIYGWGYRKYVSGAQVLDNTTIEEYTPAGTIVTQKDMEYEDTTYLLRREVTTNSKNEAITTIYRYSKDFESISPYNEMVIRNIISPVVEQIKINTTANKELIRTKTNYAFWQGNTIIQPESLQKSVLGNSLETEYSIDAYDNTGNILQITGRDGITTAYIWGYGQRYPVAKVIGITYNNAVNQSGINLAAINDGALPDVTIRSELNKLRSLPNCFISTYTYKPFTGMTSETDPDGKTIYYEYDVVGRLVLTRDKDNNILKKYAYNFQGQCTNCGAMPSANWQETGNTRSKPCELNTAFSGPYRQREERDINPLSSTYNQIRWIDYFSVNQSLFTQSEQYWVNTATPPRCILRSGQNSGSQEQEQIYIDANPCHVFNNSLRWKNIGTNTNACPLPAFWVSRDFSGNYYSTRCILPAEADRVYVSVPEGMFTSSISPEDADGKASLYAQNIADSIGTCTVPPVTLSFINNSGGGISIWLTDANTGQDYHINSVNGANAYYQNFPQGTYNIYIEPAWEDDWIYYDLGCDFFSVEYKGEVWLENIHINTSCNTITAN
jgi:YD repeat-containing protein